jgi:hypothetical protein
MRHAFFEHQVMEQDGDGMQASFYGFNCRHVDSPGASSG